MDKRISYFVIENDGAVYVKGYSTDDSKDRFFTDVSKVLAFDDCSGDRVLEIIWHGKPVYYAGWQPGMVYEFRNANHEPIWTGSFPEWDH